MHILIHFKNNYLYTYYILAIIFYTCPNQVKVELPVYLLYVILYVSPSIPVIWW